MTLDLEALHDKSLANKDSLAVSKLAGCFSCLRMFSPSIIHTWIRSGPRNKTGVMDCAICPFCSIDAVLASSDVELTTELLTTMRDRWFNAD